MGVYYLARCRGCGSGNAVYLDLQDAASLPNEMVFRRVWESLEQVPADCATAARENAVREVMDL